MVPTGPRRLLVAAATIGFMLALSPGASANAGTPGWSIVPSPSPAQANTLLGVSCPTTAYCAAVGDSPAELGSTALAEQWDGSTWSLAPLPTINAREVALQAVSCFSPSACTAVGYMTAGSTTSVLALGWDGTAWSIEPTSQPVDVTFAEFLGVSCPSASSCMAVGAFTTPEDQGSPQPLAAAWDGSSWTFLPTPTENVDDENSNVLDAVSCTRPSSCGAAGAYLYQDVSQANYAVVWDGSTWAVQHQPNPKGNFANSELGISCTSPSGRVGVGSWTPIRVQQSLLAELWDGQSWRDQFISGPSGEDTAELSGVSCLADQGCEAVGSWSAQPNGLPQLTVAESYNGSVWAQQATPNPTGSSQSQLNAVSCVPQGQNSGPECFAVGDSWVADSELTLIEGYTG